MPSFAVATNPRFVTWEIKVIARDLANSTSQADMAGSGLASSMTTTSV